MKTQVYQIFLFVAALFLLPRPVQGSETRDTVSNLGLRTYFGTVTSGGQGLADVAVSDGMQVVYTDSAGYYHMYSTCGGDFIFISLPAGYAARLPDGTASYYRPLSGPSGPRRYDFDLPKLSSLEDCHTLIVGADPQVAYPEELPLLDGLLTDLKAHVSSDYADQSVYGMLLGDMVGSLSQETPSLVDIRQRFEDLGIPFFYVAGNHDMDLDIRSNQGSKRTFEAHYGPRYYSFNRGKVHYVVLDDVFSTGRAGGYIGYLDEQQLQWLEQDLARIAHGSLVIVSLHIPTYSVAARNGEYGKEDIKKALQNRQALYRILAPFRVHILAAHEHYQENFVLQDNLHEHVHAAMSGIFWQAPYNSDGTPLGYSVYEINGDSISWYFKAAGLPKDRQFVAYMPGWDKNNPDALIANVWNYDPSWQVYWYEDGVKMGAMRSSTGWDPDIVQYVAANRHNFRYKYIGAGPTAHLFYALPRNRNARIKIEVIDRFKRSYFLTPKKIDIEPH